MMPDDHAEEVSEELPRETEEEIEEDEDRPDHSGVVVKRLAVTVLGLALYAVLERLPLPGLAPAEPGMPPAALLRSGALALGMKPLVTGFVLVELFAVLTSAGGRLREGSLAGRAQLSRIALLLGLGLALVQGFSIAKYLAVVTPYVADPGPGFILIATLTLVAGTAGLWALGMALSRMGLGNGLGLIFVFGLLEPGARFLRATEEPFPAALIPGAAGVLLALFMARMERNETEQGVPALPAFPQGVLPVAAVAFFLPWIRLLSFFSSRLSLPLAAPRLPSWTEAAMLLVLVPLLSWAAYLAVSGPRRLANDLPGLPEETARVTAMLRRRFPLATLILTLGSSGMALWALWQPKNALPLTFIGCAMVAATLLDLLEEARFTARHGKTGILLSLDNVYLARHLGWVLEDAGIAALPRARRFRSLFFFFLPLVKIDLMVPSGQAAEARARIAGEDLRIV